MLCLPVFFEITPLELLNQSDSKGLSCMRWKLLIAATLLAAITGTGLSTTAFTMWRWYAAPRSNIDIEFATVGSMLSSLLPIMVASIFVYRHTARRRALQAVLTGLLAIILSFMAFILAAAFFNFGAPPLTRSPAARVAKH